LAEIDGVTLQLTKDLGELPEGTVIEAKDAAVMTSRALIRVLANAKDTVQPRDVLTFRTACELASTIANEVGHSELAVELIGKPRARPPLPVRPSARRRLTKSGAAPRRANKNADHQTIPRFEQLVDLEFLDKPETQVEANSGAARKKWRYRTTPACKRWANVLRRFDKKERVFLWNNFAEACLAFKGLSTSSSEQRPTPELVARYLSRAYGMVRRTAGYDPLDSIALVALILAVSEGVRLEMADCHRLMLHIKQGSLMPDHVYFASGNDLDQMFILLKPGFLDEVKSRGDLLLAEGTRA
jgi:hypothetical protein